MGAGFSGLWSSRGSQVRRPLWRRVLGQCFGQVENESVVDGNLLSLPHGKAVACQAFSIRDVAAEYVEALRHPVVGRHANSDACDAGAFRDLALRLVHQAGPHTLPSEARQYVEVLDLRYSAGTERWVARAPVDCHVPGEVSRDKGDDDRANPLLLFRKVVLVLRAGLILPPDFAEGFGDRDHVAAFERAYHEVSHHTAENRLIADSRPL